MPLRARGADIGVLAVFDRLDPEHPLGSDDVVALESFASSAATRIVAARALEDERLSLSIATRSASAGDGLASCTTRPCRN